MTAMTTPSLNHTIWLEPQGAAFIYLPKVACTSWKLFLGQALGLATPTNYADVHAAAHLPLPYVSSYPEVDQRRFQALVDRGELELIAVLREPCERILSAYLDKLAYHRNPNSYFSRAVLPAVRAHAGISEGEIPSFCQFLRWIASGSSEHTCNDHWLPMSTLLGLDAPPESTQRWQLWPMAQMQQAAAHVNQLLGANVAFPGAQALGSRPSSGSAEHVAGTIQEPAVQELLLSLYGQDLTLFQSLES